MKIDIHTLAIVLAISHTLQVVVFSLQYLVDKSSRDVKCWLLWSASTAVGFIFMILRDFVSPKLILTSIFLTNTLMVVGQIFLYIGIIRFLEHKIQWGIVIPLFAGFVLATFFAIYVNRDDNVRVMILYAAVVIFAFLPAYALQIYKTPSIAASATFLSAIFFVFGGYFVFRLLLVLRAVPIDNVFAPTAMQTATFLTPFIANYFLSFGLIVMNNQQSNAAMNEAKEHFEMIFNTGPDAVLIACKPDGRLVGINDGFTAMTGYSRSEVIGRSSLDVHIWKNPDDRQKVVDIMNNVGHCENLEVVFRRKDGSHLVGLLSAKIITVKGTPHVLSITRDITNRKKTEEALWKSLEEIKTLKGIVPICANCKKIRDDRGYWEQVEAYVSRHTEAQFSHSICPDCIKRLYPEFCRPNADVGPSG